MLDYSIKSKEESLKYPSVSVDEVNQVIGMPKVVQVEKNGRLVSQVIFEETPIEKMNDGLKVDDFALEVLLANGYEPHRVDVVNDSLEQVDQVVKGAEALSKAHAKVTKKTVEPK